MNKEHDHLLGQGQYVDLKSDSMREVISLNKEYDLIFGKREKNIGIKREHEGKRWFFVKFLVDNLTLKGILRERERELIVSQSMLWP